MIISHELKIIFLKTKKVAGTSFEMALSKFCGPNCILTPIYKEDELERKRLGYRSAQNFLQAERVGFNVPGHINCNVKGDIKNHDSAQKIYQHIGPDMFNDYFKVSIYRDPLDYLISYYYFAIKEFDSSKGMAFKPWVAKFYTSIKENYFIAPETGPYAADVILKYENIDNEIMNLKQLPDGFADIFFRLNAKGNFRDNKSRNTLEFYYDNGFSEQEIEFLRNVK